MTAMILTAERWYAMTSDEEKVVTERWLDSLTDWAAEVGPWRAEDGIPMVLAIRWAGEGAEVELIERLSGDEVVTFWARPPALPPANLLRYAERPAA